MPYIGWPHLEARGWGAWGWSPVVLASWSQRKAGTHGERAGRSRESSCRWSLIASNFVQGASISYKVGLELTCGSSPQGYDEGQVKTWGPFTVQGGLLFIGFVPLSPQRPGEVEGRGTLPSGVGWPLGLNQAFWLWDHEQVTSLSEPPLLSSPLSGVPQQAEPETSVWGKWFIWELIPGSIEWGVWGVRQGREENQERVSVPQGPLGDLAGGILDCSTAGWGCWTVYPPTPILHCLSLAHRVSSPRPFPDACF